jgi:hypothetical protein
MLGAVTLQTFIGTARQVLSGVNLTDSDVFEKFDFCEVQGKQKFYSREQVDYFED